MVAGWLWVLSGGLRGCGWDGGLVGGGVHGCLAEGMDIYLALQHLREGVRAGLAFRRAALAMVWVEFIFGLMEWFPRGASRLLQELAHVSGEIDAEACHLRELWAMASWDETRLRDRGTCVRPAIGRVKLMD